MFRLPVRRLLRQRPTQVVAGLSAVAFGAALTCQMVGTDGDVPLIDNNIARSSGADTVASSATDTAPRDQERTISHLAVSLGSGRVVVTPTRITATEDFRPHLTGSHLKLEGRSGSGGVTFAFNSNNTIASNNTITVSIWNGDDDVAWPGLLASFLRGLFGDDDGVDDDSSTSTTIQRGNSKGDVVIDGVRVTEADLQELKARRQQQGREGRDGNNKNNSETEDDGFVRELELPRGVVLNTVRLAGSADVHVEGTALSRDWLEIAVTGSGDVRLHPASGQVITRAGATVAGSGDISMGGLAAEHLAAKVTGSGDIKGFCALKSADAKVVGSGDIYGFARSSATVDRSVVGSGSIDISRRLL